MELNCNYDKNCFEIPHNNTNIFIHTTLLSFNHACHEHSLVRLLDRVRADHSPEELFFLEKRGQAERLH